MTDEQYVKLFELLEGFFDDVEKRFDYIDKRFDKCFDILEKHVQKLAEKSDV